MSGWRRLIGLLGLSAVALVVAHDSIFLLEYGPNAGAVLAATGHGNAWAAAVLVVLGGAASFLAALMWRLRELTRIASRLASSRPQVSDARPDLAGAGGRLIRQWIQLTALASLLFVVQENLERLSAGEPLPGLAVLASASYPIGALVIAAVSFAVAAVSFSLARRRDRLEALIARAGRALHARPSSAGPRSPLDVDIRPGSFIGERAALRAPPAAAIS